MRAASKSRASYPQERISPQLLQNAGFRECPAVAGFQGTLFVQQLPLGATYVVLPDRVHEFTEAFVGDWRAPLRYFCGPAPSLPQLLQWLA